MRGSPPPTTHSTTRTTRIDSIGGGMDAVAKSEGREDVPSPLSHPVFPYLPSRNDMIFHVIAATNTQEVCLRWIHIIRVLQGKSEGTKAKAQVKAKRMENSRKKHTWLSTAEQHVQQSNPALEMLIHHPQRALR